MIVPCGASETFPYVSVVPSGGFSKKRGWNKSLSISSQNSRGFRRALCQHSTTVFQDSVTSHQRWLSHTLPTISTCLFATDPVACFCLQESRTRPLLDLRSERAGEETKRSNPRVPIKIYTLLLFPSPQVSFCRGTSPIKICPTQLWCL